MSFSAEQTNALSAKLDPKHVSDRQQAGRKLSYIEGWHAIAEANRIFGFDAWDRETVWVDCVWSGERKIRSGDKPAASYVARVRVTVRADGDTIVREGTGAGSGFGNDHGEAHESAIKEAETDAMKRALMTFGNPFGLALYDKTQASVGTEEPPRQQDRRQEPPKQKGGKYTTLGGFDRMPGERLPADDANAMLDSLLEFMKRSANAPDLDKWAKGQMTAIESLPDPQFDNFKANFLDFRAELKSEGVMA